MLLNFVELFQVSPGRPLYQPWLKLLKYNNRNRPLENEKLNG
jgi:hypothetical protein